VSAIAYYVVAMQRRQDRLRRFMANVHREISIIPSWSIGGTFDHEKISAADLRSLKLFDWQIASSNPWWSRPLRVGEIACTMNHHRCWEHAFHSKHSNSVIFEDDALFGPELFRLIPPLLERLTQLDFQWDLLYLGRESIFSDQCALGEFVVPGFSYCSYGYVVSDRGLEKLLRYNLPGHIVPVDEFLPATFMLHPREDVRRTFAPSTKAYALRTNVVAEGSKSVYGSETESSNEVIVSK
jgi:glycosyl transferase, family 25